MTSSTFSRERLQRMQQTLAGHVERGSVPGLIALVCRRGEVHVTVLGHAAQHDDKPLQRDAIFRISSLTKPVTAVAALLLVEECRLRLDDPLDELLPELRERRVLRQPDAALTDTVPARRSLTLRDLLTLRAGFGQLMRPSDATPLLRAANAAGVGMGAPDPSEQPAPDEWLRRLAALPWLHQAGERWLYNTGLDLLGVVIARATGSTLEHVCRERIFEPLGMRDTSFSVPRDKLSRLVTSYLVDPRTNQLQLYDAAADSKWSRPPAFMSGAGGLCSTIDDYFAFARLLQGHGSYDGRRILSRPTVELMTTDQLSQAQRAQPEVHDFSVDGWGFGVGVVTQRTQLWENLGSYGWDGGLGTSWRNDPREDLLTLLFTQRAWSKPSPPAICHDFWNSAYQALAD